MANVQYFVGDRYGGDTTWLVQYYGAQTSTNFEVLNSSGILRYSAFGINFTYRSSGFFNSGTITTKYLFSDQGILTTQITKIELDVATRNNLLSVGESNYNYYQYVYRGDDSFLGSPEADSFLGSKGNDTIDGGNGIDVIDFQKFSEGVTVNLDTGKAITSYGTSTLVNVEDIEGSKYNDTLTGNAKNNQIQGFAGNDNIDGGAGFDTVIYFDAASAINVDLSSGIVTGGSGNDTLTSIERIIGSRFDDVLIGSAKNETFVGGFGADTINGGGGIDTIEYSFIGSGVVVNLTTGLVSGGAGNDTIVNIENITGSIFDDQLTGNKRKNTLIGGNGNDILNGGAGNDKIFGEQGNDLLTGGKGKDILTGGEGIDLFEYTSLTDSLLSKFDVIKDFDADTDLFLVKTNPTAFNNVGSIASLDQTGISDKLTRTEFKANAIAQFTFGKRTFVAINDTTSGFNAKTDAIIEITGFTGTLGIDDFTTINTNLATLKINDVTVTEGQTAIFTVTREGAVSSSLTVNYTTADSKTNKATAESDYTPVSGTLSFSPYETTKTITVPTLRDTLLEGGETFFVKLTDPSNANIADGRGLGTINESSSSYFLTEPDTWAGAQAQAQAAGGNLVTVNDLEEHQLLLDTFGSSQFFWIGLTDQEQEGVFRWINGEPVTFTNWVLAEPNNAFNNEDYVAMNQHIAGGWNDLSGNQLIRGIVEINNIL